MKSNAKNIFILILLISGIAWSCKSQPEVTHEPVTEEESVSVARPAFSADSAYYYIYKQVEFGPRVPGSEAHEQCATWLSNVLEDFGAEVKVQTTTVTTADKKKVPCYNIIGTYNPGAKNRILLGAHWDTRPWADQDNQDVDKPIDGANDGASGVGVLLELARQLKNKGTDLGIDIIFFDVEDSGLPNVEDSYCLGSQYWARNLHVAGYTASKGILLDMVGAANATFTLEGTSMQIAPDFMRSVWNIAHQLGHGKYFQFRQTAPIIDDHLYVYRYTRIPMIDIIHYDATTMSGFGKYWHTHNDNMSVIDKATLQAVGETVLAAINNL